MTDDDKKPEARTPQAKSHRTSLWTILSCIYIPLHGMMLTTAGAVYLAISQGDPSTHERYGILAISLGLLRLLIGFYYFWRCAKEKRRKVIGVKEDNCSSVEETYCFLGFLFLSSMGICFIFIGLQLSEGYGKDAFVNTIMILCGVEVVPLLMACVIGAEVHCQHPNYQPIPKPKPPECKVCKGKK